MFSKKESQKLREAFWVAFGKSYPKKWILYRTKIKGFSLKFHFDVKRAIVALDVEGDLEQRILVWEKLISLQSIIREDYLPEVIFEEYYILENQKEISRIYMEMQNVSIHNKDTWRVTMEFLYDTMTRFEAFFMEYKEAIVP